MDNEKGGLLRISARHVKLLGLDKPIEGQTVLYEKCDLAKMSLDGYQRTHAPVLGDVAQCQGAIVDNTC